MLLDLIYRLNLLFFPFPFVSDPYGIFTLTANEKNLYIFINEQQVCSASFKIQMTYNFPEQ